MTRVLNRRLILLLLLFQAVVLASTEQAPLTIAATGAALPPWTPGTLDIHQIATGRGNAAFFVFPDGTTMLVDIGDVGNIAGLSARPDSTQSPAQWVARYIQHMLGPRDLRLDYAVLTHYHLDHVGGIEQLAKQLPIDTVIDRGDSYLRPPDDDPVFRMYRRFIDSNTKTTTHQVAEAGSVNQIVLRHSGVAQRLAPFEARVISVNDRVWTGVGSASHVRFPAPEAIPVLEDRPTENMCSVTLRIKYGPFDYFTGGDQPGYPTPGAPAWHDVETDVAKAIGPTDVHVVNHHGSIEEENLFWLRTLASRVMIVPAWSATHPSPDVLKRMLATRVYAKPRDVFVTSLRPETKATIGARANQVASDEGHVVLRVEPGGARYWVIVLDDTAETYRVTSIHGPYQSE